jgi:hypothetical protein
MALRVLVDSRIINENKYDIVDRGLQMTMLQPDKGSGALRSHIAVTLINIPGLCIYEATRGNAATYEECH